MGLMQNGQWISSDEARKQKKFAREAALFRNWVSPADTFPPAPDRYHLYVSLACPWASRTVIVRKLKRLEAVLGFDHIFGPTAVFLNNRRLEQDNQFPFLHDLTRITEERPNYRNIPRSGHLRPVTGAGLPHQAADGDDVPISSAHHAVRFGRIA